VRLAKENRLIVDLLGRVGQFVLIARLIEKGKSLSTAAKELGIVRNTAAAIIAEVTKKLGLGRLLEISPGVQRGENRPKLSAAGRSLLTTMEAVIEKTFPQLGSTPKVKLPDSKVKVAIQGKQFLVELLRPVIRNLGDEMVELSSGPQTLSLGDLLAKLKEDPPKLDLAIVWAEPNQQVADGLQVEWLDHPIELVLISATRESLQGVCRDGMVDLHLLSTGDPSIAFRDGLAGVAGWCARSKNHQRFTSFSDVLLATLTGSCTFGVVPGLFGTLDLFRAAHRLEYAPLPSIPPAPNCLHVVMVSRSGEKNDTFRAVEKAITKQLARRPARSPFDLPAKVPTDHRSYRGNYFGYFVETLDVEQPVWCTEVIRLNARRAVHAGAHTVTIDGGEIVNDTGVAFDVHGGVVSDHILYLVANEKSQCKDLKRLARGWPHLGAFLEGQPLKRRSTKGPASFLGFLPYFRKYEGKGRWIGFWLGMNERRHPLANGMVISETELTQRELQDLSKEVPIRLMTAMGFPFSSEASG
jgi:hypothetical protein